MTTENDRLLKVTFVIQESLEVFLDFTNAPEEHRVQFAEYVKMYDVNTLATVLNLQTWAAARHIPCTLRYRKTFHWWSLVTRFLLMVNRFLEKNGQGASTQPVPWSKK